MAVMMWNSVIITTSTGDLRRKQSNHKTDESVKTGQSVGGCFY